MRVPSLMLAQKYKNLNDKIYLSQRRRDAGKYFNDSDLQKNAFDLSVTPVIPVRNNDFEFKH